MKRIGIVIILGGLLGIVTLLGQTYLPGELSQLANCYSVWLLASFAGGLLALRVRTGAVYGALVPVIALAAYYVVTTLVLNLGLGSLGIVAFWLAGGLTAGPLLGMLGYAYRTRNRYAALTPAAVGALFLSEGCYQLFTLGYGVGYIFFGLGIIVFLLLVRKEFPVGREIAGALAGGAVLYVFYAVVLGALGRLLA